MKNIKVEEWFLSNTLLNLEECQNSNAEDAHYEADSIIIGLLYELGLKEIAEAYKNVPKWYA